MPLKRTRSHSQSLNNLRPILQYVVDNVLCAVVEFQVLMSSVVIAFRT